MSPVFTQSKLTVPNISQSPHLGFNTPMRVQYVRNKWENFAIIAALAGVMFFVSTLESGRESSPGML